MMVSNVKITTEEFEQQKIKKTMNAVAKWCSFYRANPQRFVKDYLSIDLKLFQQILIYMMMCSTHFMYLASRGQGKSFLIAIYAVTRCILYPGTKIVICSKTKSQAANVLEKIKNELMFKSANLRMEIKDINTSTEKGKVEFHNGSTIKIVTANDNARSNRANILIIDEFRMVDASVINTVLRKFLTSARDPEYLKKPEYSHMQEPNQEMYLSSCWYKSHWSFEKVKTFCTNMVKDTHKYFVCSLPYQLAIKEGLYLKKAIEDEMSESDFNAVAFMMEMCALWFSEADGSLYSYEDISKCRQLKYPWLPKKLRIGIKGKQVEIPRKADNEKRILSADIALMSSKKRDNDATSIFINSMVATSRNRYVNRIVYTENHEGMLIDQQALLIRRLFDEYECDYIVIDANGIGFGVVEALMKDIYDPDTGVVYEALSCFNNPEIAERCQVPNAPKKIYAIKGNASFNSECALGLREAFRIGKIQLLEHEVNTDELLAEMGVNLPYEERYHFQLPYIHTTLLVDELINLEYEARNGVVRVKEKSGMRKDRYSSLSYNIYVAKEIERGLQSFNQEAFLPQLIYRKPVINRR